VGRVLHTANSTWTATNDFSAGQLDARVTSLRIGRADTTTSTGRLGTENATFIMGKGALDVTTLTIGQYASGVGGTVGSSPNIFAGIGNFNLNDAAGIVTAESVVLADNIGTATGTATKNVSGTFNLNAGTLEAKTIDYGTQTGNATTVTRNFNFSGGTVRNYPGFNLAIANVPINLTNGGSHIFEATASESITVASSSVISGSGQGIIKTGAGILTLSGTNTYTGNTIVSNGTLQVAVACLATNSTVSVAAGAVLYLGFTETNIVVAFYTNGVALPAGVYNAANVSPFITGSGSLQVVSVGSPASTNALLTSLVLNPLGTLSPSFNSNVLTYTATNAFGTTPTVTVVNADPTATNQLIYNGATNTLTSGVPSSGLALNLGVNNPVVVRVTAQDGLTVQSYTVNVTQLPSQTPPTLSRSVSGGVLTLTWPGSHLGYTLLQQTNARSLGMSSNWVVVPGSASVTTTNFPVDATKGTVFYRLVYP
jgi:autotransporter-associated beta strand protein